MLRAKEFFDRRIARPDLYSALDDYPQIKVDESEETEEKTAQATLNY